MIRTTLCLLGAFCLALAGVSASVAQSGHAEGDSAEVWDGTLVQYGGMHETIGKRQMQGRVSLQEITAQPHFFGVAALENLEGEITIRDGVATVTRVNAQGALLPASAEVQATLLIGAYVPAWTAHPIDAPVDAAAFDDHLAAAALAAELDVAEPFIFTIEGSFRQARLHVINGACPMHARLNKVEIPAGHQPFEAELEQVTGAIVGVLAKDAVGRLTHPATSTHIHLLYTDPDSGEMVTGHLEQVGVAPGAVLRLPKVR